MERRPISLPCPITSDTLERRDEDTSVCFRISAKRYSQLLIVYNLVTASSKQYILNTSEIIATILMGSLLCISWTNSILGFILNFFVRYCPCSNFCCCHVS
jgi:hypothetical protein